VQWTISYEPAGLVGRVSNEISGKARVEEDCANSLRQLRRLIIDLGHAVETDNRRRQTLQPVPSVVRSSTQPIVVPPEESAADTKPRKPEGLDQLAELQTQFAPENNGDLPPGMPENLKVTPPQGIPKVDLSKMRYADEMDEDEPPPPPPAENFNGSENTQILRPGLPPPTDERDTGEVSIWEAFGLKAPSKADAEALDEIVKTATGELKPLDLGDREEDTATFSPLYEASILRVKPAGQRRRRQRKTGSVKVRQPREDSSP
jgi:hypothetical protein